MRGVKRAARRHGGAMSVVAEPIRTPIRARRHAVSYPVLPCPIALLRADELPHPERALARGEVVRVRRGTYADAAEWRQLAPWDRYLAQVHAVAAVDPGAVLSHESAAVVLGMGVIGDPKVVHLLGPSGSASRHSGGIRAHTTDVPRDLIESGGLILTSPRDTAVTLARHRHNAVGLAAVDAALRIDCTLTREDLIADNKSRASSRGRRIARWPIARATPLAETALESLAVAVIEWLGFPPPILQQEFVSADGTADRGDLWWADSRLLGEVDGEHKYDGRFGAPTALLRERRERDVRLVREHVRAVAHWGWSETAQIDPVRSILLGHGLTPDRPENTAPLHSLRRLLAPYSREHSREHSRETTTARRNIG